MVFMADYSYAVLELLFACQSMYDSAGHDEYTLPPECRLLPTDPTSFWLSGPKGQILLTLQTILDDSHTRWSSVCLPWYDGQIRLMGVTSQTPDGYPLGTDS